MQKKGKSFFMKKILRNLMFFIACVGGVLLHPCWADFDTENYVFVRFIYPDNIETISNPWGLYMSKEGVFDEKKLFIADNILTQQTPFSKLETLPRVRVNKFKGFYTEKNGAGQKIIDEDGNLVSGWQEALSTEDEIVLYSNFVSLDSIPVFGGDSSVAIGNLYALKNNGDGVCGIWANPYGEDNNDEKFSGAQKTQKGFFDGAYDRSKGLMFVQPNGEIAQNVKKQVSCETNSQLIWPIIYARWKTCQTGEYFYLSEDGQETSCIACPENPDSAHYVFAETDSSGIEGCVLKLDVAKSECAEGTDVSYKYSAQQKKYMLVKPPKVVPETGKAIIKTGGDIGEYCGVCAVGKYIDSDKKCIDCPVEENIGDDKLYNFFDYSGGTGIGSCAVRLNLSKSTCGEGTKVEYVYNESRGSYVRNSGYVVYEGIAPVKSDFPADNELLDYCGTPCTEDVNGNPQYYVNGDCGYCNNGYYLKGGVCEKCPAGYYCNDANSPNNTSVQICSTDTFSEAGAKECSKCEAEYTTKYSNPSTDGLCLENGYGCVSSSACKKIREAKLCFDSNCNHLISIGDGIIKIMSTNQSVFRKEPKAAGQ